MAWSTILNKSSFHSRNWESVIFNLLVGVTLLALFSLKYFPSLDGPAHLYNSHVILDLLKGQDSLLKDYYELNSWYIPNWFSHIFLAGFNLVAPMWLAEKLFIGAYIIGLAWSFRLLCKQLNPNNTALSFLIFPFILSSLFCLGFYNYSISFVFLFLTLYYWLKTDGDRSLINYMVLFFLLTATFFAGVLTYGFLGITLGFVILIKWCQLYLRNKVLKTFLKGCGRELAGLLIIALPTLILTFLFYQKTVFNPAGKSYTFAELLTWLNDGKVLISYVFQSEVIYTRLVIHLLVILIAFDFYHRWLDFKSLRKNQWMRKGDFLLAPALLSLVLFFLVPDNSGARMMSHRYNLMFFLLLIAWIATSEMPKVLSRLGAGIIILIHIGIVIDHHDKTKRSITEHSREMEEVATAIKPGAVVYPVNLTDNWIELHVANYMGLKKPMVILENYEADIRWFPVRWNLTQLPNFTLGPQFTIDRIQWKDRKENGIIKMVDYVLLYGIVDGIKKPEWDQVRTAILTNYHIVKESKINYYKLYEKNTE